MARIPHFIERKVFDFLIGRVIKNIRKSEDPAAAYMAIVNRAKGFWGSGSNEEVIEKIGNALQEHDSRWVKYIDRIVRETDPFVAKTFVLNIGYEGFYRGTKKVRANREKYGCNIPWIILFDPTNACNMHCKGCWSGTYGDKCNMSFEHMNKIVTEGKELGIHLYMMTGGEPLVRKKDIIRLADMHKDCMFVMYSNSTLIDDALCKEALRLGNITFMLSIEGTPDTNDSRRGDGHYDAVMKAMDLLHKYGIIFGTSICYTRENIEAVTDIDFIKMLSAKGARYGFYFHYMPVGNNAVPELMPTVEQRKYIIDRIRYIRTEESGVDFFPMDFQNDGEAVGGCIAGGRNYFHINANGDAEPCVFIHFSDTNIKTHSVLEMLQAPLFMEYHKGQPFNKNHLRPCPMLENPQKLRDMVARSGAHGTNEESEESVEHLCAKCDEYAAHWADPADDIWAHQKHRKPAYLNYDRARMAELGIEDPALRHESHSDNKDDVQEASGG